MEPSKPLSFHLAKNGFYIFVKASGNNSVIDVKNSYKIQISWNKICRIQYHFDRRLCVIFIGVSPEANEKLRAIFKMEAQSQNGRNLPYFDSTSESALHKFIMVGLKSGRECEFLEVEVLAHLLFFFGSGFVDRLLGHRASFAIFIYLLARPKTILILTI